MTKWIHTMLILRKNFLPVKQCLLYNNTWLYILPKVLGELYFASKKDLWPGILIWTGVAVPLVAFLWGSLWLGTALMTVCALFIGWIWLGTGYTFTYTGLEVKCGPFKRIIPFEDINLIQHTRDASSGPALSLDRLEIQYARNKSVLISPSDKNLFLKTLREHSPQALFK